jgi:hypothetical protein
VDLESGRPVAGDAVDLRVLENGRVELRGLFSLVGKPQTRDDPGHLHIEAS